MFLGVWEVFWRRISRHLQQPVKSPGTSSYEYFIAKTDIIAVRAAATLMGLDFNPLAKPVLLGEKAPPRTMYVNYPRHYFSKT